MIDESLAVGVGDRCGKHAFAVGYCISAITISAISITAVVLAVGIDWYTNLVGKVEAVRALSAKRIVELYTISIKGGGWRKDACEIDQLIIVDTGLTERKGSIVGICDAVDDGDYALAIDQRPSSLAGDAGCQISTHLYAEWRKCSAM